MSGFVLNTDFSGIKPNEARGGGFPASDPKMGWLVKIIDSGTKENSKKTGVLGWFKVEGLEGPVLGQVADYQVNLANPNQQAVDIGFAELSAIAHVTGTLRVGNSMELHGKPFRMLWRVQKDSAEGFTECYGVLDANGNPPGKAGQGPVNAQPAGGGFGGPAAGTGFAPSGAQAGQTTQQPNPGWNPNPPAGGGAPAGQGGGWGAPAGGGNQPDPNANPNPGWQAGGAQAGGQPDWARGQR